jgi:arylsulfatase A-like enzyme
MQGNGSSVRNGFRVVVTATGRACMRITRVGAGVCLLLLVAGCQFDHDPHVNLDIEVQRPESAVVIISADGVTVDVMDELLASSDLPNLQWMIDHGVRVRTAISGYPTITYAQFTSLMTGQYAGHHGILGNKWFDRYQLVVYSYNTTETYRDVDRHFRALTLYERMPEQMTVSIQNPVRRGVTRTIDNWATGGIRWFFQQYHAFDSLMPTQFELIGHLANETGRWPVLVHAYHPATDEIGHRWGSDSQEYRDSLRNLDRQVGRIRAAVESAGMTDRTYFVFVSDHGFVDVTGDQHFDVNRWLTDVQGLRVTEEVCADEWFENRYRHFLPYDAVLVNGGNRRIALHLRGEGGWFHRPTPAQVQRIVLPDPETGEGGLAGQAGVGVAAYPVERGETTAVIEMASRVGRSRVHRRIDGDRPLYRYEPIDADALGDWADDSLSAFIQAGWHDSAEWLAATIDTPYPDVVVQMAEMFDSPRAGDVALFADTAWDFGGSNGGGHGGITRADMRIPMIFVGPDLPAGKTISHARLVDVAPTVLRLLAPEVRDVPADEFDGMDRAAELRKSG